MPPPWTRLPDGSPSRTRRTGSSAPILYQLREDKDAFYLFLCNTSLTDEDRARDIFDAGRVAEHTLAFPNVTVRARLRL